MDNPETLETLGTQKTHDEDEQNTKTKKISNTESTNKQEMNPGACEGSALPVSYKTPTVLLILSRHVYRTSMCLSFNFSIFL